MSCYGDDRITHPYVHTRSGRKLHYELCESVYDFTLSGGEVKPDAVAMTEQQAADWLADDPRRSLCGRCRPSTPHGRLRVIR